MMKTCIGIFLVLGCALASADDVEILKIDNVHRYQFEESMLKVDKDIKLSIKAAGAEDRYGDDMVATGWILDSKTRKIVWELSPGNAKRSRTRFLREADEKIDLPRGLYEVYYAVSPMNAFGSNYRDIGDFFEDLFGSSKRKRQYRRYAEEWGMTLSVDKKDEKAVSVESSHFPEPDESAIVQFVGLGDSEYEEQGFTLTRDTKVRIYALGEGDDGDMFDYGWIVNAKTGETVWQMRYRRTDWAGGADKNRILDTTVDLDKGDYLITYVTDGSHSYEEWNMMPPRDPRYWGITVWGADKNFKKDKSVRKYEPKKADHIIVDMTRAGDDFFEEEGFMLTKRMPLRIRCLGEMGSGRRFADYGWIIDANTRETVWEMTQRNTRHAGGGSKNRMFDGVVTLDAGSYIAYYIADGSHAYRSWNTKAPFDPRAWGLTIWGHAENFDPKAVKAFKDIEDESVLASLIRAEDSDRLRDRFKLDTNTRVRIYCLGEGSDDDMNDYGWIEDEDGRTVWRMEYWDTEHAGGARKNRMINEVIRLKAGEYRVYYRTDGSHAYGDWNADPPRDPMYWGITVRLEK